MLHYLYLRGWMEVVSSEQIIDSYRPLHHKISARILWGLLRASLQLLTNIGVSRIKMGCIG